MKICVLFNPQAGSAGQIAALRKVFVTDADVSLRELGPNDDLARLASQSSRDGFDVIAVAGGDGTVHAAANGLIADRCTAALAILPLGTGNDLCRTLDIPLDPLAAVKLLRTGTPHTIDAVRVEAGGKTRHMVNAVTGGFSGQVAAGVTSERKDFWGPLAYLRGAVGTLAGVPRFRLTVRFDGGPAESFDVVNIVVANARTAAGGLFVAPRANPEDGRLNIVIVRAGGALDLSVVAARLMHGDYTHDENVIQRWAKTVEITSEPPLPVSIDGERLEATHFTFTIEPGVLRVVTGPNYLPALPRERPVEQDDDPEPAAPNPPASREKAHRLSGFAVGMLLLLKRAPRVYIIGLWLLAILVVAFVWLAEGVVGDRWHAWNESVRVSLGPTAYPGFRPLALGLTWFGGWGSGVIMAGFFALFLARKRYLNAATLVVVMFGIVGIEVVLKATFSVARPPLYADSPHVHSSSFPSGHALRAFALFGFLAVLAAMRGYRHRRPAWALATVGCGLLAIGVCWSRVYLGVHWPTDVIAGALVSSAWVAACVIARYYAASRPRTGTDKSGA